MGLADVSVKRPVFITCLVIIMLVLGYVSLRRLGVELFPDVNPPVVSVITLYPGTGPKEIESIVTKPIEDSVSTIAGAKRVSSNSLEGVSQIVIEFYMETDIKQAEQRVRDKVAEAKVRFPNDVKEPVIQALNFSDQAVIALGLVSKLSDAEIFDLADRSLKPRLQQLQDVGNVKIFGGRKREIQVLLDRQKVQDRGISAGYVARQLGQAGANIPAGKIDVGDEERVFRSHGEFDSVAEISNTVVSFFGNENATRIADVAQVKDTLEDEVNRVYVAGKRGLVIEIFKQSKTNTVALSQRVAKELPKLIELVKKADPEAELSLIRDGARKISLNIDDVKESIFLGILLTIIVVYLFLGNFRSTIITGLAIPNSLLGSFILMQVFGLSINIVTLLGLSLVVGLLIDDAIVVRENIFRYLEKGMDPRSAALKGTKEVTLAVVATTLVVMSVFGPIALTQGLIGKILANFGLVICFAMVISLFDAMTIAPMLSAYFAGNVSKAHAQSSGGFLSSILGAFDSMQQGLERIYGYSIDWIMHNKLKTIFVNLIICVGCFSLVKHISATFIPSQDEGEFAVNLELAEGSSLDKTNDVAMKISAIIDALPEVAMTSLTVGGSNGEANKASFYIRMKAAKDRKRGLSAVKEDLREQLKPFADAGPKVQDYDFTSGGMLRPFTMYVLSNDTKLLEEYAQKLFDELKNDNRLKDIDTSFRPGKAETNIELSADAAAAYGLNTTLLGGELRAQVQGVPATVFRDKGEEYDVRVRMREDQRDIKKDLNKVQVLNLNNKLVRLSDVATVVDSRSQASINRQNRNRAIMIAADLAPKVGIGDITATISERLAPGGDLALPPGVTYTFVGESENFEELVTSMIFVLSLAVTFIYLVLSSLYESFITPLTILLTLPLALCGAFVALYAFDESINLFSVLGMLMLLGVCCKNSILLVDFSNQRIAEGESVVNAIRQAGVTRLRPILMTSLALIAGTIPIAIGLNEASAQRVSMGIAIIGGVISSTILSLVVVPALLPYFYTLSHWSRRALVVLGASR